MDWDDIKARAQQVRAPGIDAMSRKHVESIDGLITLLKSADAAAARQHRRGMALFVVAGGLLAFAFFVSLIPAVADPGRTLRVGLLALLYAGISLLAWRAWHRYARVDYAGSVWVFLEEAEKRYRLFSPRDVLVSLPLVLILLLAIYAGGAYVAGVMARYFGPGWEPLGLAIYAAVITAAFIVGIVATRADWKKTKAPLWREIRRMMAELSEEEKNGGNLV